jgi:type II secretory pathway pseudopilin PulG
MPSDRRERTRRRRSFRNPQSAIRNSPAFTLLELVLVMLVLSVVLAMVAPSLSGFGAGREAEFAGAQVMTLSRWAREQAITDGRVYRLNFNPSGNVYFVTAQVGGVFERVNSDWGQDFFLPDGVQMQWDAPQEAGAYCIDFHPSGRAQPVRIQLTSRDGQVTIIGNRTATEMLHVMTPQEAQAG